MERDYSKIIAKINRQIGSDVGNLSKVQSLVETFKQDFTDTALKLTVSDDTVSSKIKSAIRSGRLLCESIDVQQEKANNFLSRLEEKLNENDKILDDEVIRSLKKIRQLEHLYEYFRVLKDISDISDGLKEHLTGKDEQKTISFYLLLCGGLNSSDNIIDRLRPVEAVHLKAFAAETATYWYNVLSGKYSKEFEGLLKIIKWPITSPFEVNNPHKDVIHKMGVIAEYLFLIKPPGDADDSYVTITPSIICPPISAPVQLLLKPYRQRFLYHFTGTRQTNRLDKPEWFFTQILAWAKESHLFVAQTFQSAALLAYQETLNVRLEFIRGLVQLTIEKLCTDIEQISEDDHLFAHLIDETLSFEQELKETLGYPSTYMSAISVITQPQYMMKWLTAEEKFSTSKMDAMLTSGSPWEFIDPINLEELKIPRCADHFIRLLDAIKERYCNLPQPRHQLQFLNLQLELIENFRRRLVQLHSTSVNGVSSTKILNAINYLISVLREWGEHVHYLHLHGAIHGPNSEEISLVFDQCIDEFDHWQRQLVNELATKAVNNIKAKSLPYRHDNWITMPTQNVREPQMLSVTASEMFQVMVSILHNLETELSSNIFDITIRLIAKQIDNFFIYSMILNTKFSTGGTIQFQFDMTRNLFALFGQYVRRPELLFKKVFDACILLTLPTGSAILLQQTLTNCDSTKNEEELKATLKDVGVNNLNHSLALDILERRNDTTIH
ncbi:RINT1-like protein [Pseudolycoriella hygida]|uniref:RINT1-like protein n=1 Tax=Pseudolycoriella hygida TaxID=35572 RepID=A0A9Q0S4Z8_9DIPT|nr:RINT1-like protein [Pseudolycoriella hygida]